MKGNRPLTQDAELLSALRLFARSDADRIQALVREHQASIYRVAYRLCGTREDAEDLLQETLLEAYKAFGRFTPGTHFDRWIFRIMRNTFIDRLRCKPRVQCESLDAPIKTESRTLAAREIVDQANQPDLRLMARMLDGPIQDALDALPPDYRIVVVLSDIQQMTYQEISRTLGCPIGTVRSRLHRGRAILKDRLKSYARF